jgi:hypothetical protein
VSRRTFTVEVTVFQRRDLTWGVAVRGASAGWARVPLAEDRAKTLSGALKRAAATVSAVLAHAIEGWLDLRGPMTDHKDTKTP